jgi:WD40 repeat protein
VAINAHILHPASIIPLFISVQGVRALCLRAKGTELVSGGSDGTLIVWDIDKGSLGRVLKTIPVR